MSIIQQRRLRILRHRLSVVERVIENLERLDSRQRFRTPVRYTTRRRLTLDAGTRRVRLRRG